MPVDCIRSDKASPHMLRPLRRPLNAPHAKVIIARIEYPPSTRENDPRLRQMYTMDKYFHTG